MLSDQELKDLQSQMTSKKIDLSSAKDKVIKGENIFSRIGADLSKRGTQIKEAFTRQIKGEQTGVESGLQTAGAIAGGVGDVVGNIAIGALNKIIPSFIKEDAKEAAQGILQTKFGKDAVNAIGGGMKKYEDWKKSNPRAAANFESVINVADLASDVFGVGAVKSVAKETAEEGLEQIAKKGVKEIGEEIVQETGEKVVKETIPEAIEKTGKEVIEEVPEKVAKKSIIGEIATTATSQATGLDPKTIRNIISDPDLLKKTKIADRDSIVKNVQDAFTKKIDEVSNLGKEYNIIRESKEVIDIPKNTLENTLSGKYGFTFSKNGKIKLSAESSPLSSGDIKAIEQFMGQYGNATTLSPNAYLNARKALDNMADWGTDKTDLSAKIARELRSKLDEIAKPQVKGLAELDAKYGPQAEFLKQLKKDITTNGEISVSKIANLDGKNKTEAIKAVREIIPDIDEQLKIVKAIEDIELAKGNKIGTYTKGATAGLTTGILTGNPIVGLATGIMTYPSLAIPMIEQFGRFKKLNKKVIEELKNQLKSGKIEQTSQQLFLDMLNWANSGLRKEAIRGVTAQ